MDALALIRRLHEHRAWVNHLLLEVAGSVDSEQLHQSFAIGQGSIWKSLVHLYAAEWVWLATLEGNLDPTLPGDLPGKLPGNQEGEGAIASFAVLKERWRELEQRWDAYLNRLTPAALEEMVEKVSSLSRKKHLSRRADILMHVCTHAHYTTAQVMNMLRHAGVAPLPDVMLISLARGQMGVSGG